MGKASKRKNKNNKPGSKNEARIRQLVEQGIALFNRGELTAAEQCYHQVLEQDPRNFDAYHLLGLIAFRVGMWDVAIELIEQALKINPKIDFAYEGLGSAYMELGEYEKAYNAFSSGLEINNNNAKLYYNIGRLYIKMANPQQAITQLKKSVELDPQSVDACLSVAHCNLHLARYQEVFDWTEKALKLNPMSFEAYAMLAQGFYQAGHPDMAKQTLENALALQPNQVNHFLSFAVTYLGIGDKQKAAQMYQKVLDVDPYSSKALYGLTQAAPESLTDNQIEGITKFIDANRDKGANPTLAGLGFAVGGYFDKIRKDPDTAFHYINIANEITSHYKPYDRLREEVRNKQILTVFDEAYFKEHEGYGIDSSLPVFIVGMPRSGTTLVESILASHSKVFGAGELNEISLLVATMKGVLKSDKAYPLCMSDFDRHRAEVYASLYQKILRGFDYQAERIIDKMPQNFQQLGFIATLFPNASIVHLKRNPLDVALSCYMHDFAGALNWSYKLEDFIHYYNLYESYMTHWARVLPLKVYEVQYETLIADQEKISRELIDHLGLEWEDQCLNFHQTDRIVRTASVSQVRQPIYSSSKQKWKQYEKHLQAVIEAFPEYSRQAAD